MKTNLRMLYCQFNVTITYNTKVILFKKYTFFIVTLGGTHSDH